MVRYAELQKQIDALLDDMLSAIKQRAEEVKA